ncbi:peptidase S8/S53 domain-containing protein [Hypoxylon cercidicola]|nr:peptidase S8/S53 domain-containing protein [Hypoxylon cercidicola]
MTPPNSALGSTSSTTSQPSSTQAYSAQATMAGNTTPAISSRDGDEQKSFVVFPIDKFSLKLNNETENALAKYSRQRDFFAHRYGDELSCWTLKLTNGEAKEVKGLPSVEFVEQNWRGHRNRAAPPPATIAGNATSTIGSTSKEDGDRQKSFFVFPIDSYSLESNTETEKVLKKYSGNRDFFAYRYGNELDYWTLKLTDSEANDVKNLVGVKSVVPEGEGHRARVAPPKVAMAGNATSKEKADGDKQKSFMVFPIDKFSFESNNETENALKKYSGDREFFAYRYGDELDLWSLKLTDSEAKEVKNLPGVKFVERNAEGHRNRVAPPEAVTSPIAKLTDPKPKHKRADPYTTQLNAPIELVAVSQPSEDEASNIDDFKNYVYEKSAGKNSFVYHLEDGVAYRAQSLLEEFTKVETIQTTLARTNMNRPDVDLGDSHATCVAGKAVGKKFGVAKEATLIVVKANDVSEREQVQGYRAIRDDLASHPERHGKSVVVVSLGYDPDIPRLPGEMEMRQYIQDIMDFDVPVVVTAGNEANDGRFIVDDLPGILEGPDFPMIVVGSTTPNGEIASSSQRGDHVQLYAVGESISCLSMDGTTVTKSGTSFAAPIVAGQIAVILSHDPLPFQTKKGDLVKDLKKYLTSGYSSVKRGASKQRMIWNGVHLIDNPKS